MAILTCVSKSERRFREDGYHGKGAVWWYPREKVYSAENVVNDKELEELKQKLKTELDQMYK